MPVPLYFALFATASVRLHSACMVRLSRSFLILLALVFSARLAFAADSREANAFDTAMKTFKLAPELSEKDFADFVQNYRNSVRKPEAILYEARAMLSAGRVTNAVQLLTDNLATNGTGKLAPEYLYRLGLAYFQNNDYPAAAATFGNMVDKYPDSFYALDATIRQADAFAHLGRWRLLIETLSQTNKLFQESVHKGTVSATIASGFLLLGEAQLALGDTNGVERTLRSLDAQSLNTQLKWQRDYLVARLQRIEGRLDEALQTSNSLLAAQDRASRAEGVAFQGGVLEQQGNLSAAANIYTNNLAPDVPPEQQRRAILKIAELDLKLPDKLPDAVASLTKYLEQKPAPEAADIAMLTLAEVRMKQALNGETNLFDNALAQLQNLTNSYPNSPAIGKALLDLGWCLWSQGKISESQRAFRGAADRLPYSEEQAEARFKWADTQFAARDFAAAVTNYNSIAEKYASLPEAKENRLIERALYQSARAALNEHDLVAATSALKNILAWYPNGLAGPSVLLLAGQGFVEQNDPAGARQLFEEFEKLYPDSPLLSEVRLATARSYEAEKNWDAAITNYVSWTEMFTNHHLLAQAQFSLAWDQYMAGRETNALILFTNFIVRFPTNELAARAQFWVGDFYFRQGDSSAAEINYQLVFQNTNWPVSELTYEARMRAGRSATAHFNYKQAINYFTNLLALDCPPELRVQATFGYADATIAQDSTNKTADINEALRSLQTIVQNRSNTVDAAQAWGMIGNCHFELGAKDPGEYTNAVAAYTNVISAPAASSAAVNEARFKLGATLEKQAALKTGAEQTALMKDALRQYVTTFNEDLDDPDGPSALWIKKSGMAAGQVAESLQQWDVAGKIYDQLKHLLPMLAPTLDKKIAKAAEHHSITGVAPTVEK